MKKEVRYISSGGIDATLIPVGTEEEAKALLDRILKIVERRSSTIHRS